MRRSREILLRLYHDPRYRFDSVVVCYTDRGAPGDESCAGGERISVLGSQFMEIESPTGISPIPYHRITRILYEGTPLWEKGHRDTIPR
ncbi:MAG: DUF504 domain-containing protein [Methanoregulaceae archaeon]|nr:DUF504 domain-containing protein [Methanoregulaceae archaeon]